MSTYNLVAALLSVETPPTTPEEAKRNAQVIMDAAARLEAEHGDFQTYADSLEECYICDDVFKKDQMIYYAGFSDE